MTPPMQTPRPSNGEPKATNLAPAGVKKMSAERSASHPADGRRKNRGGALHQLLKLRLILESSEEHRLHSVQECGDPWMDQGSKGLWGRNSLLKP